MNDTRGTAAWIICLFGTALGWLLAVGLAWAWLKVASW